MTVEKDTDLDHFRRRSHFASLDGIRFLCILAVLWHHTPMSIPFSGSVTLLTRGFVGVDFFFVLSGFLITTLLLREERANGAFSLAGFYWRRGLRILPVYFLVVGAVSGYYVLIKGQTEYAPLVPFYFLFLSNFLADQIPLLYPTWSLAVEEQYYLFWPIALILLPRKAVLPILIALIAVNLVFAQSWVVAPELGIGPLQFVLPRSTYAAILIGSLLGMLMDRENGFHGLWVLFGHRIAAPVMAGVLILALHFLPQDLKGWPTIVLQFLMAGFLAAVVMREDHPLKRFLTTRPIRRIGAISYGIYLYHLIALHLVSGLAKAAGVENVILVFLTYSAFSVLLAEASDRTLERYARRFRGKIGAHPQAKGPKSV